MTTIATPPAAALDALLDRLSAGKSLTADEAALLRAGVTGLRRTAGGLQRRSQQQAARIAELEADGQAVLKREAIAQLAAAARAEFAAEQGKSASPAEEIAYHAMGLGYRLDAAEAAIERVRRLCELTMAASMRVAARHQAIDTLAALDGAAPEPPLRDRLAAAIRAATCPGCCPVPHACHLTRPQPTVWDQNGRVIEVEISGPIDRVAAIIAGALAGEAS
ncbi:hypothetical protein G6W47_04860 [Streptomyces sp. CAI-21]|uniref:hypothetical protein n=1 Tax=Streptomyces sp. CAI-21 TaxID=1169743 RepID=UPI001587269D|nr:hypothetical protein [Streptomyces sp. CAI-21]